MQIRKVAVITDALSPGFFFPLWHDYYGAQFGEKNLHVVTINGRASEFGDFELGSVTEISPTYDDNDRLRAITVLVAKLLTKNQFVIRVDCDEFLVAEPRKYPNLRAYMDRLDKPYVTSRGFEVFQHDEEAALNVTERILVRQRKYAMAATALNKTGITSEPLRWNRGFHHCDRPPVFDDVFLFHLKRADLQWQLDWNKAVASQIVTDDRIRSYYETPEQQLRQYHKSWSMKNVESGVNVMYRKVFNEEFASSLFYNERSQTFDSKKHTMEPVNVLIPNNFDGVL